MNRMNVGAAINRVIANFLLWTVLFIAGVLPDRRNRFLHSCHELRGEDDRLPAMSGSARGTSRHETTFIHSDARYIDLRPITSSD
jgi:hypothetical protein